MADKNEIKKALLTLDPANPAHWTADNLPRVEALGLDGLKRGEVTRLAPHFTREHPTFDLPDEDEPDETNDADPEREPLVQMESSEFGSDVEDGLRTLDQDLPLMPAPQDSAALQATLSHYQSQLQRTVEVRQAVAHREKELNQKIYEIQQRMGLEVPAVTNQSRIMAFLASTQTSKPAKSALDAAFEPQRDPSKQRPVHTPRDTGES